MLDVKCKAEAVDIFRGQVMVGQAVGFELFFSGDVKVVGDFKWAYLKATSWGWIGVKGDLSQGDQWEVVRAGSCPGGCQGRDVGGTSPVLMGTEERRWAR